MIVLVAGRRLPFVRMARGAACLLGSRAGEPIGRQRRGEVEWKLSSVVKMAASSAYRQQARSEGQAQAQALVGTSAHATGLSVDQRTALQGCWRLGRAHQALELTLQTRRAGGYAHSPVHPYKPTGDHFQTW